MQKEDTSRQDNDVQNSWTPLLLSFSCCLILANLYYAQPILSDIAENIGLELTKSGFIVTMIQIGYAAGIVFLVPLGDVLENRRLIPGMIMGASLALFVAALSNSTSEFFVASFFIGLFSASMQAIIPFAIGLAKPPERGKILGILSAGATLGMILARPVASFTTSGFGWRPVYFSAAALMLILGLALFRLLPRRAPSVHGLTYPAMLASMGKLLASVPRLPLRLSISAVVFFGFSMFWASAPIVLRETMHFSHSQVALFALAGLVTPPFAIVVGRLIDRGYSALLISAGIVMVSAAYMLTLWFGLYAAAFVCAVFMLDPGMNMTAVAIQQNVLSSIPEARSRLNALCLAALFAGGALGSASGPWLLSHFDWNTVACMGAALMLIPFALNLLLHGSRLQAFLHRQSENSKTGCPAPSRTTLSYIALFFREHH